VDQEPPKTTGAGEDGAAADDGACDGCERPPPLEPLALELLPLELEDCAGWLTALGELDTVRPWNERAATSEITPDRATAPAIIQRLIFPMSARPASRVVRALEAIARLR
jgi:hypothetical protein